MKQYCLTVPTFHRYEKRNFAFRDLDYAGLDPQLRCIIPYINKLYGVQTVFSCAGHFEKNERSFYVVLAVAEVGFIDLFKLFDDMNYRINSNELKCSFAIKIQSLKVDNIFYEEDESSRPMFVLEAVFRNKKDQDLFYQIFDRYIFEKQFINQATLLGI